MDKLHQLLTLAAEIIFSKKGELAITVRVYGVVWRFEAQTFQTATQFIAL